MATRKDPWKSIGRPSYEGIHRMPFELVNRARVHEFNRQRAVAKVLVELYLMTVTGIIDLTLPITVAGALSQSLFGSKTEDTEAAHCVPRQVYVGTEKLQDLLSKRFAERGLAVAAIFGEADILPSNFNKSDSRAEGLGLADGLQTAAEFVAFEAGHGGALDKQRLSITVKAAHSRYRQRAVNAFQLAITQLQQKIDKITRSRVQHVLRTKEEKKWREQFAITETYLSSLGDDAGLHAATDPPILDGLIRIYSEI